MVAFAFAVSLVVAQQPDMRLVLRSDCPETVTVPFTQGKHPGPLVEVEIGGKRRRMMMDTGAGACVVQQKLVDELGLKPFLETQAQDPSGKNSVKVGLYRIPEIKIGGATFYGAMAFVQPAATKSQVSDDVIAEGILSFNIFRDQLLVVDYAKKSLSFGPGELPASAASYTAPKNTPIVEVGFGGLNVPCQVDTGAQGGLMVPLSYKEKLPLASELRKAGKTRTLFNTMDVWEADLKGPVTLLGKSIGVGKVEMHDGFREGNIGGKVLGKYRLTIDQKNKRIELAEP